MKSLTRQTRRPTPSVEPKPALRLQLAVEQAPAQCCAKVTPTVAGCHD